MHINIKLLLKNREKHKRHGRVSALKCTRVGELRAPKIIRSQ